MKTIVIDDCDITETTTVRDVDSETGESGDIFAEFDNEGYGGPSARRYGAICFAEAIAKQRGLEVVSNIW